MLTCSALCTALVVVITLLGLVDADACNPLNGSCPAIPGLPTSPYSIDFTQQTTTPPDWILADGETVTYGAPNGANFTFAKRNDAPYIWSRFYILFGRIEVVAQAAPGVGIITGAVLLSDDLDEIDWEWSGNNFAQASGEVQTNYFGKGLPGNYDRGTTPAVHDPVDQFHTYALDWSPTQLTWSIDGTAVRTLQNSHQTSGGYQYPQTPSRLHLGVWCAGDPANNPSTVYWGGGYTNFSLVPFSAYVKSVKITTSHPCSSWQYPNPFDGTYQSVLCTNQTLSLPCSYTVVQGDNGQKIANSLDVSLDSLKAANPHVIWDLLLAGQTLNVPGGICASSSTIAVPSTTSNPSSTPSTTSTIIVSSSATSAISLTSESSIVPSTSTTLAATHTDIASPPSLASSAVIDSSSNIPSSVTACTTATTSRQSPQGLYTVVAGDYGYAIADKLGCSFDDLQTANPGTNWDLLTVGQTLNVPSPASAAATSSAGSQPSNTASGSTAVPDSGVCSASAAGSSQPSSPPTNDSNDSGISSSSNTLDSSAIETTSPVITSASPDSLSSGSTSGAKIGANLPNSSSSSVVEHSESSAIPASTVAINPQNTESMWFSNGAPYGESTDEGSPASSQITSTALTGTVTSTSWASSSIISSSASRTGPAQTSTMAKSTPSNSVTLSQSSSSLNQVHPTTAAPSPTLICNQDNCLRNLLDPRYSSSMHSFCTGYTTMNLNPTPLPTFLGGCSKDVARVSSACSCLMTSLAPRAGTSETPAMMGPAMRAGTSSWRLKRSPLRWERAHV